MRPESRCRPIGGLPCRPLGLATRFPWHVVVAPLALPLLQACSSTSNPGQDGLGDIPAGPDSGQVAPGGPFVGCTAASEGCACGTEGAMVACPGVKIHVGSRTICPPGVRICLDGAWGACVPTDVLGGSSQTQDYQSTCGGGTTVRWGSLTLDGQIPGDAVVGIGLQTADSHVGLDVESYQLVGAFDATLPWSAIDTGAILTATGHSPGTLVRVTVLLTPASNGALPTVTWKQGWDCVTP